MSLLGRAPGGKYTSYFICIIFLGVYHLHILFSLILNTLIQTELRTFASLGAFKKGIKSIFFRWFGKKRFNVHLNRWASILHACLRLGSHSLNEYLFNINCCSSPICHCGIENETVEHYFLYCPRFAAQCVSLFASAERMCGRY